MSVLNIITDHRLEEKVQKRANKIMPDFQHSSMMD